MRVCSNTSPLSNLAIIGRLELLWHYYDHVYIPTAVWEELEGLKGREAFGRLQDDLAKGRIKRHSISIRPLATALQNTLDRGESEAIALATELQADLLLMDEHDGRATAERLGIPITGILGVLRKAKLEGLIPSMRAEISSLRAEARFFISGELEQAILKSVGE